MKNGIVAPTSVQDIKLPWKVKIGYSIGNFAKALLAVSVSVYLLYFYTDICGIDNKIASTIILIAKIWDIINDPMMGAIVDRTISKEGRCRFYLKYFSVPAGIIFALSFIMPDFAMPGKIAWAAVTYILQGMASTILLIPLNTLMGRLTSNQQERMHMNQFGNAFSLLGTMFVTGYTMKMVLAFSPNNMQIGFSTVACIFAALYIVCHLIVYFTTRGYDPLEHLAVPDKVSEREEEVPSQKVPAGKRLVALLKNKMWLLVIAMWLLENITMSLENAALPFYLQYNHGENMDQLYSLYSTLGLVIPVIVILCINHVTRWLGIGRTALFGAVITTAAYAFRFIAGDASVLIVGIGWGVYQLGGTMMSCTVMLLIFASKEYGAKETGVDNDAILMSGFSVSYKIGMAIGGAVLGYVIPAAYVPQAAEQASEVLKFFFNSCTLFPMIGSAICIAICVAVYVLGRRAKIKSI